VHGGWERAGDQIREARTRAGYTTISEFARACHVGAKTIGDLERGRRDNFSPKTIYRVEAVLGWPEGSILRIVEGRRAIRNHDPQLQLVIDAWRYLSPDARRIIATIVRELRERE
jgi:transcriptional regulator with XRE-family HTH domain